MNVIIIGSGKVGYTLAVHLSRENHNVVLIDKELEALRKASDTLDVLCMKGNGLNASVLLEAGAKTADLIIAVTSRDEINMLCCLTAKKLGIVNSIARIRDPEYTYELSMIREKMGLSMVINPEQQAAAELIRLLRFPSASNIETFVNGRVEIVSFRVLANDLRLIGIPLAVVMKKVSFSILFCTIVQGEKIVIPDGNSVLQAGDLAYIVGQPSEVSGFLKYLGKYTEKIKEVMVIGGGRISYYLCRALCKMGKKVKLIEINEQKCLELSEGLPDCLMIHGDGTDDDVLLSENISDMGAVIAVTDRDEENIIISLYAKHLGVPKVITKVNRLNYVSIIKSLGLESIISPKNSTAYQILRFVRAMDHAASRNMERLYKIADGQAEAAEFVADEKTQYLEKTFRDIQFRKGFLVAAIVRNKKIIIPTGNDFIAKGDNVIIVTKNENVMELNDVFDQGGK